MSLYIINKIQAPNFKDALRSTLEQSFKQCPLYNKQDLNFKDSDTV